MESLYFLIPIALVFVAIALRFLLWALNSGQYDNLDTEAHRILFDEDEYSQAKEIGAKETEAKDTDAEPVDAQATDDNADTNKPVNSQAARKGSLDD